MNFSLLPSSIIKLITTFSQLFSQYFADNQDPRTVDYPLINVSPCIIIAIMSAYLILTTHLIPKWMKNREPLELRSPMFVYNCFMIFMNGISFLWIAYKIYYEGRLFHFKYPIIDNSPSVLFEIRMFYYYWLSKFVDLVDTFFFSLRKKSEQTSFLHLYHHTAVPIFGWLLFKINPMVPGIQLFIVINSFIHVLMYSYYALAAFGPAKTKYLWWKRHITVLQLVQFIMLALYIVILAIFQTGYPIYWLYFGMTQPPFFFYMFYDFYRNAYGKKKPVDSSLDKKQHINNNDHQVNCHEKQK